MNGLEPWKASLPPEPTPACAPSTLTTPLRLLDLDGSVTRQSHLRAAWDTAVVPLRDIGPSIRYLATKTAMRTLERRLDPTDRNRLTLIGSGDFHHVTAPLLRAFDRPLSLVVFDTHPDWDRRSPWACCGSWILETLRMPHVRKIVMIGLGAGDIRGWRVNIGPVSEIRGGRVAFYPHDFPRSRTWPGGGQLLHCARLERGDIFWNTVRGCRWEVLLTEIIRSLPTEDVYVSVDKDCLTPDGATTNWEPGGLTLAELCGGIGALRQSKTIIGGDITGEWSPVEVASPLFRALLRADHPPMSAPSIEQLDRNEATNAALLAAFGVAGCRTQEESQ